MNGAPAQVRHRARLSLRLDPIIAELMDAHPEAPPLAEVGDSIEALSGAGRGRLPGGRIVEMDWLADPARLRQLDLTILDD